jgi:hypothetical protein
MSFFAQWSRRIVAVGMGLMLIGSVNSALAGQPYPIVVKATHKGEKFEVINNDERTGRMVFFSQSKATDRETRGKGLYNDSARTTTAHWDLVNGYGTGSGFSKTEKGGGSVLAQWNGVCYPVNGADGKAVPHCSGGWFIVTGSGSGPFSGLKGGGSWTGAVTPDGGFDEEWMGLLEQ